MIGFFSSFIKNPEIRNGYYIEHPSIDTTGSSIERMLITRGALACSLVKIIIKTAYLAMRA